MSLHSWVRVNDETTKRLSFGSLVAIGKSNMERLSFFFFSHCFYYYFKPFFPCPVCYIIPPPLTTLTRATTYSARKGERRQLNIATFRVWGVLMGNLVFFHSIFIWLICLFSFFFFLDTCGGFGNWLGVFFFFVSCLFSFLFHVFQSIVWAAFFF